jgi:hypothetical protein
MIERYARKRGRWLYGSDDGAYLMFENSLAGRFPVHLSASGSTPDFVTLRAHSSARFARAERTRLLEWVNRFNDRTQRLTASVMDSADSSGLRIVGSGRFCVSGKTDFNIFTKFVDQTLASAAELFEGVEAEMELPSAAELQKWFQLSS